MCGVEFIAASSRITSAFPQPSHFKQASTANETMRQHAYLLLYTHSNTKLQTLPTVIITFKDVD